MIMDFTIANQNILQNICFTDENRLNFGNGNIKYPNKVSMNTYLSLFMIFFLLSQKVLEQINYVVFFNLKR